jgi:hypothetical protein
MLWNFIFALVLLLPLPGVWTWNFGDDFSHVYLDSLALNHNAMGRGYETFGNGTAETLMQSSCPDEMSREWYRPSPPPSRPFRWSSAAKHGAKRI